MEISTDKIIRRKSKEKIVYCLGGECQICGYKKCNDALHLHHIDPSTKSFTVGGSRSTENNWEIIKEEIKKCILLCGNCHSEYHNGMIKLPEKYAIYSEEKLQEYLKNNIKYCKVCSKEISSKRSNIGKDTCSFSCTKKLNSPYIQMELPL